MHGRLTGWDTIQVVESLLSQSEDDETRAWRRLSVEISGSGKDRRRGRAETVTTRSRGSS